MTLARCVIDEENNVSPKNAGSSSSKPGCRVARACASIQTDRSRRRANDVCRRGFIDAYAPKPRTDRPAGRAEANLRREPRDKSAPRAEDISSGRVRSARNEGSKTASTERVCVVHGRSQAVVLKVVLTSRFTIAITMNYVAAASMARASLKMSLVRSKPAHKSAAYSM